MKWIAGPRGTRACTGGVPMRGGAHGTGPCLRRRSLAVPRPYPHMAERPPGLRCTLGPELPPRGRGRSRRQARRPSSGGASSRRLEISDPRWCLTLEPEAIVDAVQGRSVARLDRRGQDLVWGASTTTLHDHAPAHDRDLLYDPPPGTPTKRGPLAARTTAHGCVLRLGGAFGTHRRAGLGTAARATRFFAARSARAARRRAHRRGLARMARGPARAGQGFPDSTSATRRRGQHLRPTSALSGARVHPLRPGRQAHERAVGSTAEAVRGHAPAGLVDGGGRSIDDFSMPTACAGPSRTSPRHVAARACPPPAERPWSKFGRSRARDLRLRGCHRRPRTPRDQAAFA